MASTLFYIFTAVLLSQCEARYWTPWDCHKWTDSERKAIHGGQSEAAVCRAGGNVFTKGNNGKYKGCFNCWCCVKNFSETHVESEGEAAVGEERFGEGLKPDGDCLVSRYSKQGVSWGKHHPVSARYGWQQCDVQKVGEYCEESWDCDQYKCVNKKCVTSGMDWDEETLHWDDRTWEERSKGSEGMRGSDAESAVGTHPGICTAADEANGCRTGVLGIHGWCICGQSEAAAQETEALAYAAKRHGASPLSLVNLFAAFGFAMTVYGAFRHYVK